jgi:hypothetical protein
MSDDKKKNVTDYMSVELSPKDQEELNKPLKDDSGVDPKDMEFLKMLVDKIEKKEIDLLVPSSLINQSVYDGLDENARGKADVDAYKMLATIRDIYKLWQAGDKESYQIQYMVNKIRIYKEELEEIGGDIFII